MKLENIILSELSQKEKDKYRMILFLRFHLFICQRERERESERAQADRVAEGEAGSLRSKEPDVGLDPRMLRS